MDVGDWEEEAKLVGDLGTSIIGMVEVGDGTVITAKTEYNYIEYQSTCMHKVIKTLNICIIHTVYPTDAQIPVYITVPVVVGVAGISVSTEIIVKLCVALYTLPVSVMLMVRLVPLASGISQR